MNEVRIAELIQFNNDYYAGQLKNILYRCNLIGPFIFSICEEDEEETLRILLLDWFDICDKYSIDLIESLIELYTKGKIQDQSLSLYDLFPEYMERVVNFLLGKESWEIPEESHKVAEDYSTNLTAQVLTDIYSK